MELSAPELRGVEAVFDRAALIALPPRMRAHYVDHLLRIVPEGARILLVTLEYDQSLISGPPHAVLEDEVLAHYGGRCEVERIAHRPVTVVPPAFAAAGVRDAAEAVYRIVKRT
jgi:thiopurine S-methyltransferase